MSSQEPVCLVDLEDEFVYGPFDSAGEAVDWAKKSYDDPRINLSNLSEYNIRILTYRQPND